MGKQTIDIGSAANDGTGDDLRTGATKINENFTELYGDVAALKVATGSTITGLGFDSGKITFEGATDDTNETVFQVVDPTKDNTITLPDSSGTVALIDDITRIIDSNYVALITGAAFSASSTLTLIDANALDSGRAIRLIDSTYVQARENNPTLGADFVDSDEALKLIDANALDSGRGLSLIDANSLDSGRATRLIDSSYVRLRADSDYVKDIIDSAYIKFIADSDYVKDIVDSAHVKSRATEIDLRSYTVGTLPSTPVGSHGKLIFTTNGASGAPCLAVFDSAAGFFKRIALGAQVST